MKSVGLLVIVIIVSFGHTQAPDTLWTKTYGGTGNDVGNAIKQTSDGGYIIAGSTESFGAGGQDVWLLKTDANGDTLWTKTYGGVYSDWAADVQQTIDGGYIIAATTSSFGYYGDHIWLIKTDSLGNAGWMEIYGGGRALCIETTSDSAYIVSGCLSPGMAYPGFIILTKIDADGNTIWCRYYFVTEYSSPAALSVIETFDGGYVVAGGIGTLGPWTGGFLLKTDASGDSVWCNEYWPTQGNMIFLLSVTQTADSGYVACGPKGPFDTLTVSLWIVKTSAQGDTLWTREYGDSLYGRFGNSVQLTYDDGYIITGGGGVFWDPVGDLFLFKTNENGDSLWCTVYGGTGDDVGNEVQQTNDGGYIVVGSTESYGAGGKDVWIIKTGPDVGIEEQPVVRSIQEETITATIFRGPLQLPAGKECKVFDITGRVVEPDRIQAGIYFLEIDGKIVQKVIKVR